MFPVSIFCRPGRWPGRSRFFILSLLIELLIDTQGVYILVWQQCACLFLCLPVKWNMLAEQLSMEVQAANGIPTLPSPFTCFVASNQLQSRRVLSVNDGGLK